MPTAALIEPRCIDIVIDVLVNFRSHLPPAWDFVFFCGKDTKDYWKSRAPFEIEYIELSSNNLCPCTEYNDLLKSKWFWDQLKSEYILIFQTDTWLCTDPVYNIDYFIQQGYSYIGGNMSYRWHELEFLKSRGIPIGDFMNFNGGLSLRNRQDMLRVIEKYPPEPTTIHAAPIHDWSDIPKVAEDVYFTIGCIMLGLRVGNDAIAANFACHTIYIDRPFGIHQWSRGRLGSRPAP